MTINRSLWYLVTEEIEEQDIVYGQTNGRTAGRRTKGYPISSPGLRPVELKTKSKSVTDLGEYRIERKDG